jgi:hypothetical protein
MATSGQVRRARTLPGDSDATARPASRLPCDRPRALDDDEHVTSSSEALLRGAARANIAR